jgi:predicted nucleic acid-binding protein
MRYLLDTNIIIEAVANSSPATNALFRAVQSEWCGYSAITRLEIFGYPDLTSTEEEALKTVVAELNEIEVTSSIIDRAIKIRRAKRIKAPDAIIAATAQAMGATLVTRNTDDFKSIEGLKYTNPFQNEQ